MTRGCSSRGDKICRRARPTFVRLKPGPLPKWLVGTQWAGRACCTACQHRTKLSNLEVPGSRPKRSCRGRDCSPKSALRIMSGSFTSNNYAPPFILLAFAEKLAPRSRGPRLPVSMGLQKLTLFFGMSRSSDRLGGNSERDSGSASDTCTLTLSAAVLTCFLAGCTGVTQIRMGIAATSEMLVLFNVVAGW